MEKLLRIVSTINKPVTVVAGCALAFVILVTVADVVMRALGSAVTGTYELVCFSGGLLVFFSIPMTSWENSQIQVEFLVMKFPPRTRKVIQVVTKCLGIALFLLITWNIVLLADELREAGQVTIVLKIPFYPIAYAMAVCGLFQCAVLVCDIVKVIGGKNE